MKRLCVWFMAFLLAASFCFSQSVFAASDFEIDHGVLIRYSGSSADVNVPDGVTAVGASAFQDNTRLSSVTLPSSVYQVGEKAFAGCSSLKTVKGGENVTAVGAFSFQATPYLEDSTAKYLMLGHALLWYNGTSVSVSVPTSCVSIAPYAFARCGDLTSFNAYEGLVSIGAGAFYGCTNLAELKLPDTLSEVGGYAFDGVPAFSDRGDFAVIGDGVLVKYQGNAEDVIIPDTVKRIAPHAFTSSKLRSVTLPASVYAIDAYAFSDCTGLREILFEDGLLSIGDCAFRGCKSLQELKTPETLSYIGQYAFSGASSLDSAMLIGDGMTVSFHAFDGCTAMRFALLSDGVGALYDSAFYGCSALGGLSVSSNTGVIGSGVLSGCDNVTVCCEDGSYAQSAFSQNTLNTLMGDADEDGEVNLLDATEIQRYIVYLCEFSGAQAAVSDFNFDGEINMLDPFMIQKKIAHLI